MSSSPRPVRTPPPSGGAWSRSPSAPSKREVTTTSGQAQPDAGRHRIRAVTAGVVRWGGGDGPLPQRAISPPGPRWAKMDHLCALVGGTIHPARQGFRKTSRSAASALPCGWTVVAALVPV
ncbi:hypothetical protein ACFFX0_10915 [Citricoccus parietis]|uniref:Uncharacterized protein n=1 Tax=Citricoccus parietis TaxID=592307 RepID=A0ABV5FYB8_9MICC